MSKNKLKNKRTAEAAAAVGNQRCRITAENSRPWSNYGIFRRIMRFLRANAAKTGDVQDISPLGSTGTYMWKTFFTKTILYERVWCTTQLAKLSFNHSNGRTHSWCLFLFMFFSRDLVEIRQLWTRPIEWLVLIFASCLLYTSDAADE